MSKKTSAVALGERDAAIVIKADDGTIEFLLPTSDEVPEEVKLMLIVFEAVATNEELLGVVYAMIQEMKGEGEDDTFDPSLAKEVWH